MSSSAISVCKTETETTKRGTRVIYYGRLHSQESLLPVLPPEEELADPTESPSKFDFERMTSLFMDVIVKNAVSPVNFTIQNYRQSENLKSLEKAMTEFYVTSNPSFLSFSDLKLHGHYAVKYFEREASPSQEEKELWVRCQVKEPFSESMPVMTYLIDHGVYHMTEPKSIQLLKKKYLALPIQSYEAKLYFISSSQHQFTPEDCHRFQNAVEGKPFVGISISNLTRKKNSEQKLSLILIDTLKEKNHYIHQDFVKKTTK